MKVKQTVTLTSDDIDWFQKAFPDASLSWILTLLLRQFRSLYETETSPNEVGIKASKDVKEMVDEGIFE